MAMRPTRALRSDGNARNGADGAGDSACDHFFVGSGVQVARKVLPSCSATWAGFSQPTSWNQYVSSGCSADPLTTSAMLVVDPQAARGPLITMRAVSALRQSKSAGSALVTSKPGYGPPSTTYSTSTPAPSTPPGAVSVN